MVWSSKGREYQEPPRAAVEEKAMPRRKTAAPRSRGNKPGREMQYSKIFDADRDRLR
jgi:hypothetical protein